MDNLTLHESEARCKVRRVFFSGSTAVALGQGLCYNRDYGTAATAEGRRDKYVEFPSTTNNMWFAGVAAYDYGAVTGGQWIEINEPGSVCQIAVGANTTVAATRLTATVFGTGIGAGRFVKQGLPGRGTALALQTGATNILASDYTATATLDATGLILTDSGATFVTKGVAAGDKVVLLAGEDDNTNETTPGVYTVSSVSSETALVLTSAAANGGTMECSYYIISGNPTVLAYLYDGEESGLVEFVQPTTGASACMVGGTSYLHGGTNPGADSTFALAAGTIEGQKKYFYLLASYSSNDFVISPAGGGITMAGGAQTSLELDAADEYGLYEWCGAKWRCINCVGTEA